MIFIKILRYAIVVPFILNWFVAYATPKIKICLTGRIVKNLPTYGQSFSNAVLLAKKHNHLSDNQVEIEKYFYDNKPLEPIRIYKEMQQNNCSVIIGFEYLTDLLLVAKKYPNSKIPIFSSYASTIHTNQLRKGMFLFRPTYYYLAKKMLSFLHKHGRNVNHVLLVTSVGRSSMSEYKNCYMSILNKDKIKYDTFDFLENDPNLIPKFTHYIRNKKRRYNYVFLLAGSISAARIADNINNGKSIFIGTENYGSSAAFSFLDALHTKTIHSYFIRNLSYLNHDVLLNRFKVEYHRVFNKNPSLLSAYTYDAANIIFKAFKKFGYVNAKSIFAIDYNGITGIKILNGHYKRSNKYTVMSVHNMGYSCEE